MDSSPAAAAVVARWQEALNRRDHPEVLALSHEQIGIVGPRGSVAGAEALREWLESTSVQLRPLRTFVRGNNVVVLQRGIWSDIERGEIIGERDVASAFEVIRGEVTRYSRFETLEEALATAGLSTADELQADALDR